MAKEQVSSILRALEILECFMDNETEWTLKRLVAQLDLPTTTVHRQLSTLTDRGYLVQDPIRKSYRVGPRLLLLSSTVLSHSDLRSTARPELEKLSATVKETINLSVMLDREIFYLDKVETFRSVVCNTKVGTRAPAHATSGGKIMLVGLGPGSHEHLTARARAAIAEADTVIGYVTYIRLVAELLEGKEVIKKAMTEELDRAVEAFERALIVDALRRHGSLARTAEDLKTAKTTLHDKIRKYGLGEGGEPAIR